MRLGFSSKIVGDGDTMRGGAGNDTYEVTASTNQIYAEDRSGSSTIFSTSIGGFNPDLVIEAVGQGIDTVRSYVSYKLPANVENLQLQQHPFSSDEAIDATGNALSNVLTGNRADNVLDGGSGADRLIGGLGNDLLIGGLGNDIFVFDAAGFGNDRIEDFDSNALNGQDRIDIRGLGITAATFFDAVTITDEGAYTLIGIGADSIRLLGVADATTITQADFLFG